MSAVVLSVFATKNEMTNEETTKEKKLNNGNTKHAGVPIVLC